MNIGNITSNNFNLDNNGKDIQIEVYEQLIEQLQQENTQLKESYSKLEGKYFANVPCCNENDCDLYRDYMKLKDNWNKLKEYLENKIDEYSINLEYLSAERMTQIKNKMQELEKGSDSNE